MILYFLNPFKIIFAIWLQIYESTVNYQINLLTCCFQPLHSGNNYSTTLHTSSSKLQCPFKRRWMEKLREYISQFKFESSAEEIHFFKEIKPRFYSKLIYYLKVFNIETRRPNGGQKAEEMYSILTTRCS